MSQPLNSGSFGRSSIPCGRIADPHSSRAGSRKWPAPTSATGRISSTTKARRSSRRHGYSDTTSPSISRTYSARRCEKTSRSPSIRPRRWKARPRWWRCLAPAGLRSRWSLSCRRRRIQALHELLKVQKGRAQLVQVNVEDQTVLRYWILRAITPWIRKTLPEKDWDKYFTVKQGISDEIRESIGLPEQQGWVRLPGGWKLQNTLGRKWRGRPRGGAKFEQGHGNTY